MDGWFLKQFQINIWVHHELLDHKYIEDYEMIDKNGYLCVRNYGVKRNIHNYEYMKQVNCVYNEIVDQEHEPYILK